MEKRMGMTRLAAGTLLAVVLLSSLIQASGFENTGVGWKARAMGGAFRAVADDWTAAYYNPAGYAWIKDNQVGGNAAFVHFRNELTPNYVLGGIADSTGYFNGRPIYNKHEILSNPSAGFIARFPIWGETVVGLSVYQPFDYNVSWQLFRPLRAYNDTLDYLSTPTQFHNNLDVVAFQVTAARVFTKDKLAIGLGVQLLRADLVYSTVSLRPNPMTDEAINFRPFDMIPEYSAQDGNGYGIGFRAGALWKATDKLNVGFTAALPLSITVSGKASLSFLMPYIRSELRPGSPIAPGQVEYLFVSGQDLVLRGDYKAKIKLPPSLGVGLAYSVNDKLTVALDAEYTLWSQYKGLDFTYSNLTGYANRMSDSSVVGFFSSNLSSPTKWSNAGKVALGASYDVNGTLTVMAGGSFDQSADRDNSGTLPQFVDTGTKLGINGGVSVHLPRQWELGFTTSYTHYPDLTTSGLKDINNDGILDGLPGTYKAKTFETILSVNYRF
jgi:long-chain fatty acid transport protein